MHYSTDLHFPVLAEEEIVIDTDWHLYEGFDTELDMWQAKWQIVDLDDPKNSELILRVAPPYSWLFGINNEEQMVRIEGKAAAEAYKQIALYNSVLGDCDVPFDGKPVDKMKILFVRDQTFNAEEYFGKNILPKEVFEHATFWSESDTPVCAAIAHEMDADTPNGTIIRIHCGEVDPEAWILEQACNSIGPIGGQFDEVGWCDLDAAYGLSTITLAMMIQAAAIEGHWLIMILGMAILEADEDQAAKEQLYTAAAALCSVASVREAACIAVRDAYDSWME